MSSKQSETANPLHDYIEEAEFCKDLGIDRRTARRWRRRRVGPTATIAGRKILYKKTAIAAWLKSREQEAVGAR